MLLDHPELAGGTVTLTMMSMWTFKFLWGPFMNIKTSHILGILHIGIMDGGKYMEYIWLIPIYTLLVCTAWNYLFCYFQNFKRFPEHVSWHPRALCFDINLNDFKDSNLLAEKKIILLCLRRSLLHQFSHHDSAWEIRQVRLHQVLCNSPPFNDIRCPVKPPFEWFQLSYYSFPPPEAARILCSHVTNSNFLMIWLLVH